METHAPDNKLMVLARDNPRRDSDDKTLIAVDALQRDAHKLNQTKALETKSLILSATKKGEENHYIVAMVDHQNQPNVQKVADELEVSWRKLTIVPINEEDFLNLFQTAYGTFIDSDSPELLPEKIAKWHEFVEFKKEEAEEKQKVFEKAPTLGEQKARTEKDFVHQIMRSALQLGASDIHFDMGPHHGMVRLRIDGILYDRIRTPSGPIEFSKIENKTMLKMCGSLGASAKISYEDMLNSPKDGTLVLPFTNNGKTVKTLVRFASIPRKIETGDQRGVKVTLRINQKMITDINELGLDAEVKDMYLNSLKFMGGIAYIVGPTGSGKTNVIAAGHTILRAGNEKNLMEYSDTIEHQFDGITQTEVDKNCTEEAIIKSYLRHDPDVIIASEVRDELATLNLVQIATAGKLVLSTLHANSLPGVFIRLEKLGVERYTQSETIRFVMFTSLVRKLCSKCKQRGLKLEGVEPETYEYVAKEGGCGYCRYVGYQGRTSLAEALYVTPEVANLIAEGKSGTEICRFAEDRGWLFPLSASIGRKIAAGITSKAEVLRVIDLEKRLSQKMPTGKSDFDWRKQPTQQYTDPEMVPTVADIQQENFYSETNPADVKEKDYLDMHEIGENDFALEVNEDFDWNVGDEELDLAVDILGINDIYLSEEADPHLNQRFEPYQEVSLNGKH